MNIKSISHQYLLSEFAIIAYFVVIKILIHLLLPEYGYHRDEYYYIAISEGFSFSNLDMLPLTPLYLKVIIFILGNSIKALHFASALCGAVSLAISILIVRELGGKKYAQFFTGLLVLFSGFLIFGAIFTYDSLDFLIWTATIYLLVKLFKDKNQKLWIPIGFLLGLGLLNKLTVLFFGFAIFLSLWLVPQRIFFRQRWIWIAGGIALLFSLPFVIWQFTQQWYFLDFAAGYAGGISYITSFPEFVWQQLLPNNLFNFPVWIVGLYLLLFSKQWKIYRFFGIIYLVLFFLFYFMGAKFYFLIPLYTILIAVGTIKIEELFYKPGNVKPTTKFVRVAVPAIYILLSLPFLPMIIPLLPIEQFITYAQVIGVDAGVKTENKRLEQLPQHIADRFGWEELAVQAAEIYHSLPKEDQTNTGIVTENWGQASALNFYRAKYDYPAATTLHGWYYYETLRKNDFKEIYIAVGHPEGSLRSTFADVQLQSIYTHPYCIPYESNKPIHLCRSPLYNLGQLWALEQKIDPKFAEVLNNRGVQQAIEFFYTSRAEDPSVLLFSERQINRLGYEYLSRGEINKALQLFQLNVDVYPASFNVYDSLAEAYLLDQQFELAISFYEKSLELNPENTNAVQKLSEIQELMIQSEKN